MYNNLIYAAIRKKQQWDLYKWLGFFELKVCALGIMGVLSFMV